MKDVKVSSEGVVKSFEYFPVEKKLKTINKLKPFFTDSANYFGIYEKDIQALCKVMGWNRK